MEEEIHVGRMVRRRLEHRGCSVAWLAHELSCSCNYVRYILASQSISMELLVRVSRALDHDFLGELAERLTTEGVQ